MRVFLELFIEFFQIGLFAVGGGPATIPFLMDLPNRHDWYEVSDVANMLAVSESTPGPIGINMATYAGFNAAGLWGGLAATLSLVLPSLIVIILIAKLLENFSKNPYVKSSFGMIRPAVTGLIACAVFDIFKTTILAGFWDGSIFGVNGNLAASISESSFMYAIIKPVYESIFTKPFASPIVLLAISILFYLLMRVKKLSKIHPFFWIVSGAVMGIVFKM